MNQSSQQWNFEVPPTARKSKDMQLLTIGAMRVIGRWQGGLGEYFVGWAEINPVKVTNGRSQRENSSAS